MIARAALLFTWLLLAFPAVYAGSNADNYFCRACGVVMEHMHAKILEETDRRALRTGAGLEETMTVDTPTMAKEICDNPAFVKKYDTFIVEGCKEIVGKNADVIASLFGGSPPTPETTYARTLVACIDKMNLCDARELPDAPYNQCEACLAVVQDMNDVLLRRKGQKGYKTRKHVADMLDDECQTLGLRHPPAVVKGMEKTCDKLVSEYEDQIKMVFTYQGPHGEQPGRALCGSGGLGVCQGRKGIWKGTRSPFAYVPEYAKAEHDEL
jgi:hypothetical protein